MKAVELCAAFVNIDKGKLAYLGGIAAVARRAWIEACSFAIYDAKPHDGPPAVPNIVVGAGMVFINIIARVPEGTPGNTVAVLAATGVAVVAGAAAATAAAGVIVVNQVTILEPKNIATMPNSRTTPIISAVEVLLSPAPARSVMS